MQAELNMIIDDIIIEKVDIKAMLELVDRRPAAGSEEFMAILSEHPSPDDFVAKLRGLDALSVDEQRQLGTSNVTLQYNGYDAVRLQAIVGKFREQNQLSRFSTWFWSKPWSVAVYLVFWGVTVLAAWVAGIRTLLEWFGAGLK